jgi:tellurite methyltransferase
MPNSVEEWDARHRSGTEIPRDEPAAFLREALPLLPQGRALDLAMGAGCNAVFLAEHGWWVTGVDWSAAALEKAGDLAHARGVSIEVGKTAGRRPGLLLVLADLERRRLPISQYDLVICIRYLQRSLFAQIQAALRPGGVAVFETYTTDQLRFAGGPRNPDFLLKPGELRLAFPALETLFYRELCAGQGITSIVARKPAG